MEGLRNACSKKRSVPFFYLLSGVSKQGMPDFFDKLLQWIYPMDCVECGGAVTDRRVPSFCRGCWDSIRPFDLPTCPCCGRPFESPLALIHSPGHICGACREVPPAFDQAVAPYRYDGVLERAIRLYKYRKQAGFAAPLAQLLLVRLERIPPCDVVLAVPLHPTRLRFREFNQALLLADRIATRLQRPLWLDHLVRIRPTVPQTELDRTERSHNVRNAFEVRRPLDLEARAVLLVDDVLTTRATVNECAKALRRAKVKSIGVLALAQRI
jgi:ComF family protein